MTGGTEVQTRLSFGDFTIDRHDERLWGPRGPIRLGNKAFQVLLLLAEQNGRLLTKDSLFSSVWNDTIVTDSALSSVIKEIRRALGDDGGDPTFIEAVYGRGYRFKVPVETLVVPGAEQPATGAMRVDAPSSAPSTEFVRLAVLPFRSLAPGDDYFAQGIAEEILALLSREPQFKVAGRTSSSSFRESAADVRSIGRKLDVEFLLEGSVRPAGDRVCVDIALVDTNDGMRRWSQAFHGELDDIFAIQARIGCEVATNVRRELLAAAPMSSALTPRGDVHNPYLTARTLIRTGEEPGCVQSSLCCAAQ